MRQSRRASHLQLPTPASEVEALIMMGVMALSVFWGRYRSPGLGNSAARITGGKEEGACAEHGARPFFLAMAICWHGGQRERGMASCQWRLLRPLAGRSTEARAHQEAVPQRRRTARSPPKSLLHLHALLCLGPPMYSRMAKVGSILTPCAIYGLVLSDNGH